MIYKEAFESVVKLAKAAENTDAQWNLLKTLPNQRKFWLHWYQILINEKALDKIETLSKEEKQAIWEFVIKETKETELTKDEKIDLVKCIVTINYLTAY